MVKYHPFALFALTTSLHKNHNQSFSVVFLEGWEARRGAMLTNSPGQNHYPYFVFHYRVP